VVKGGRPGAALAGMGGDELGNVKKLEVAVRVTSQHDGSVWNWEPSKFENRLFMMRELYQSIMTYGPRDLPLTEDPFWDPPEPVEIGMGKCCELVITDRVSRANIHLNRCVQARHTCI